MRVSNEENEPTLSQEDKDAQSEALQEEVDELTDTLKRVQAEFQNYRNRVEDSQSQNKMLAKKDIITQLLPVLDMFDLALQHKDSPEEFVKGVEMIYAQFTGALENEGLEVVETEGQFNPEQHEAVITEDGEEGKILEELQKGYCLDGRVIRCARVKVGKEEHNNE